MKSTTKLNPSISDNIIKEVESQYDWTGKTGAILLKEMKTIIKALESINYTEKQIVKELKGYDIHIKLPKTKVLSETEIKAFVKNIFAKNGKALSKLAHE